MTDLPNAVSAAPLSDDEEAQFAALQARRAAAQQAKAEAAAVAVKTIVTGEAFKATHAAMEEAFQMTPKDNELAYAVQMMDRMAARYPA